MNHFRTPNAMCSATHFPSSPSAATDCGERISALVKNFSIAIMCKKCFALQRDNIAVVSRFHRLLALAVVCISVFMPCTVGFADTTGGVLAWGAGVSNTGTFPEYGQSIIPAVAQSGVSAIACGMCQTITTAWPTCVSCAAATLISTA